MRAGLKVKQRERSRFYFFVGVNLLMNIGLTIGQSVSEGLFLSNPTLGPAKLAQVFIFTAVATALATFVYAAYVDKVRNDRYFEIIHVYSVGLLCLILAGIWQGFTLAYMAYYGFFYVTQGIFNTHFWNYATDYFDAVEAKRLFPFFPLGNSIGGFLGGTLTSLLGEAVTPIQLSIGWLLFLGLTWLLIHLVSPRLKGWVVMEAQETDEASLANIRQGFIFLRRSSMGRWHVAYAFVMVTSLFFLQYLYSDIFHQAYPDTEQLTAFIGKFLAITNLVEIFLELTFTPRLIAFAGVGAANMFYPLSTLAGFLLVGRFRNLAAAVYSRMNRETFENAISASCRNLLYNAYPSRFRGRIRAFIEGAVTNAGIVLVGLIMMVLAQVVPSQHLVTVVIGIGSTLSLIFLFVAFVVRREYLNSLVRGLKDYRLDLDDVSLEVDKVKDEDLAAMLPLLESNEDEASIALIGRIFRVMVFRGDVEPILARVEHANPWVQAAAIEVFGHNFEMGPRTRVQPNFFGRLREALSRVVSAPPSAPVSVHAVGRSVPDVRARALGALADVQDLPHIASYLDDPSAAVRAAAAAVLIKYEGWQDASRAWQLLQQMVSSDDADTRTAAVRRLPMEVERSRELVLAHLDDESVDVRLAVLEQLDCLNARQDSMAERLRPLLSDASDEVRIGALRFLGRSRDPSMVKSIAACLQDDSIHVRREAIKALRAWRMTAVPHVRPLLDAASTPSVEAALEVLSGIEGHEAKDVVREWLQRQLRLAYDLIIAQAVMDGGVRGTATVRAPDPMLTVAMRDFLVRVNRLVLAGLAAVEDPTVIRNIRRCLETQNRQARGDAMEAMSNLKEQKIVQGLLLLIDDSAPREKLKAALLLREFEKVPSGEDIVRRLSQHPDPWVRVASAALTERGGAIGWRDPKTEEYTAMKSLLFLKKVPLFSQMSLEQLEVISRIVSEISLYKGEIIFKEGEMGDKLFVIVEGKVHVVKNLRTPNEVILATLGETDHFGEMAVLDNEPRSASIVVAEDARLLSISGESLRDIIHQKPEIAFEIFKVLSSRLRGADDKLSELSREIAGLKSHTTRN